MEENKSQKAKSLIDRLYFQIEESTAGLFEEDVSYIAAREKAAKECAKIAIEFAVNDLMESLAIAKEMHPHAEGIIAGSIMCMNILKKEVDSI